LKILHVLQYSLPTLYGYTIRADAILKSQQAMGYDVVALTGPNERAGGGETINGIRYLRTQERVDESRPGLREYRFEEAMRRRVEEAISEERPDIVHVHSPAYNGVAALRAARRNRVPCVYEMRAVWEDAAVDRGKFGAGGILYRASRFLESYVLKRVDAVVTICQGLRGEVLSRGIPQSRVFVVPNAVEAGRFQPLQRNAALAESLGIRSGPVFAFLGSLFNYEGVEDLLDAVPDVLARHPETQFLVVGGGEREAQVREQVARLGRNNSIIYRPRVPHHEINAYYSVADWLVYPRRSVRLTELVTPLKPLEAMAMCKAVIASDIGGHREMVEHDKTGLLYRAGDRAALVETLSRAAGELGLPARLACSGREYVLRERNWTSVSRNYEPAYAAALKGL
jgi:PEP-CTERM/exosortase A-associated glycosyltransferase